MKIARDISVGEKVESEIDVFINRRHEKRVRTEGKRREEELWRESEKRHAERRREANRAAWRAFHEGQATRHRAVLEGLVGPLTSRRRRGTDATNGGATRRRGGNFATPLGRAPRR